MNNKNKYSKYIKKQKTLLVQRMIVFENNIKRLEVAQSREARRNRKYNEQG